MSSDQPALDRGSPSPERRTRPSDRILRLVRSDPERRAIESGQVDAVMDPETGSALLLPEAQAALREDKARVRSLLALVCGLVLGAGRDSIASFRTPAPRAEPPGSTTKASSARRSGIRRSTA